MKKIMVETSARHVHMNQQDLDFLFGKDYKLNSKKQLSQPGQYASQERVTLLGPKGQIPNVIILGPCRGATQVEISLTDARTLGVDAPVRESGHVAQSSPIKLLGPLGELNLPQGCLAAKRHVHLDEETAKSCGIKNGQIVKVACGANGRRLIFDDVVARVSGDFAPSMHIDTDESNAAGGPTEGELVLD